MATARKPASEGAVVPRDAFVRVAGEKAAAERLAAVQAELIVAYRTIIEIQRQALEATTKG